VDRSALIVLLLALAGFLAGGAYSFYRQGRVPVASVLGVAAVALAAAGVAAQVVGP
jgi:hypothetical protein